MNKERILNFISDENTAIVDAMEKIDSNANGILFVVNNKGQLAGCLTDGDIRRWLLRTGSLKALVNQIMTKTPVYLNVGEEMRAVSTMKKKAINALPILDSEHCIRDIVLLSEAGNEESGTPKGNLSEIPVVIMAGGKGTRLYPYTKILPKPLIPIGDTPIVERIINCFAEYGIDRYYMTVNYKKEMIKSYFAEGDFSFEIYYVEEDKPLGTGGSLKLIQDRLEKPLFVSNCDSLILADYYDVYMHHIRSKNRITMVASLKNITIPYGVLHTKENGELVDIEEKPKLSYFINTGMYVIDPDVIDEIPEGTLFHMTHLVEKLQQRGEKIGIYPISEDSFLDMGEFSEMRRMEEKLHIAKE